MLSLPFLSWFLHLIYFWFYVVSLLFSICFCFGVCLLVWVISFLFSFFLFFFSVCECMCVCLALLLPFVLGFCLLICLFKTLGVFCCVLVLGFCFSFFFFFFLFLHALWLAGSWCSGWGRAWASKMGEPSPGHRTTRELPAPWNINQWELSQRSPYQH